MPIYLCNSTMMFLVFLPFLFAAVRLICGQSIRELTSGKLRSCACIAVSEGWCCLGIIRKVTPRGLYSGHTAESRGAHRPGTETPDRCLGASPIGPVASVSGSAMKTSVPPLSGADSWAGLDSRVGRTCCVYPRSS